jgi:hypothetical protein
MTSRLRVDFNELVESNLVLLSKSNVTTDIHGTPVYLCEGLRIEIVEENAYDNGTLEVLFAEGLVEANTDGPPWTQGAKWCCRIDAAGIRDIAGK